MEFLDLICELLLLDSDRKLRPLDQYKKAFTASAVRRLYEGAVRIWPPDLDVERALHSPTRGVSGLYVGDYGRDELLRGIIRHSSYASKLLICDPILYPLSVREEYSPLFNPDQHRSQTLQDVNLWIALAPWIKTGLLEVIRTPCDFDPKLKWDSLKEQQAKFDASAELREAGQRTVKEMLERHSETWKFRSLILSMPDQALLERFSRMDAGDSGVTKEDLLAYVNSRRASDPDFLEPIGPDTGSQLQKVSSGASYNVAALTARLTGSYLVTDLHVKWREIELDRRGRTPEMDAWSPFAKAFQEAPLRYLDDLSLQDALTLRREGRLEHLRAFMRRVWSQACDIESYATVNAALLAEELQSEIARADEEWKQIDRDLMKNAGAIGAGVAAAAPMFGSGQGEFLAAAAVIGGVPLLASSLWQRRGFADRFPAAFFLHLRGRG